MKIAVYQGRFRVDAITDNAQQILACAEQVVAQGAQVLVLPECALTGYAPRDLLLQEDFKTQVVAQLESLVQRLPKQLWVLLGTPYYLDEQIFNALLVIHQGKIHARYFKQALPNYSVFDERRYFTAGDQPGVVEIAGFKCGLLICEDLWDDMVVQKLPQDVDLVFSIHASPFTMDKRQQRLVRMQALAQRVQAPCIYAHQVHGQDELIFDGASFVVDQVSEVLGVLPQFETALGFIDFNGRAVLSEAWQAEFALNGIAELYQALVFSVREYVQQNGFKGVLLGLSGGVDSALSLAILVDALGADAVEAVLLPSRFTSEISIHDAQAQADILKVKTHLISIEPMFESFLEHLPLGAEAWDVTEENLQARARGTTLMALSNKFGKMVVSTTNKSEIGVGYGTLYGDLIGGFDVLKDVYKTDVYRLAHYRNAQGMVIPERVLTRAPSAELRQDQRDQDSLPEYDTLDAILRLYVEENLGIAAIVAQGFKQDVVRRVIQLVKRSEYKRRQAPIGPKVSKRAFGDDWRIPITKG